MKNILGQRKKFESEKKNLVKNNVWPKKILGPINIGSPKMLGQEKFWANKFWVQNTYDLTFLTKQIPT